MAIVTACLAIATSVAGQENASTRSAPTYPVRGIVYDSINARPLAGAQVQLVAASPGRSSARYAAVTDSWGAFTFSGVVAGDYLAGFFHPALDTLGIESGVVPVHVDAALVRLALSVPSPSALRQRICGAEATAAGTALLIGHVRHARTLQPLTPAAVALTWDELRFPTAGSALGVSERTDVVDVSPEGWFASCAVPAGVSILVRAGAGADSSGQVRVLAPERALRHVTLYVDVGSDATEGAVGSALDSSSAYMRPARLAGTIRDDLGRPVENALVRIWGTTDSVTTSARGEFLIERAPAGTQTVDVRAIGHIPSDTVLQFIGAAPSSRLDLTLSRRPVSIAGVTVKAHEGNPLVLRSFYERMHDNERGLGFGSFITQDDIEKRKPVWTTSLFHDLNRVRVLPGTRGPSTDVVVNDRGCVMSVYLDGARIVGNPLGDPDDSKINILAPPGHIAGIEVYPRAIDAPGVYQILNGNCGVILIWTK